MTPTRALALGRQRYPLVSRERSHAAVPATSGVPYSGAGRSCVSDASNAWAQNLLHTTLFESGCRPRQSSPALRSVEANPKTRTDLCLGHISSLSLSIHTLSKKSMSALLQNQTIQFNSFRASSSKPHLGGDRCPFPGTRTWQAWQTVACSPPAGRSASGPVSGRMRGLPLFFLCQTLGENQSQKTQGGEDCSLSETGQSEQESLLICCPGLLE